MSASGGGWWRLRGTTLSTHPAIRGAIFAGAALTVAAFALYSYDVTRKLQKDAARVALIYAERILPAAWAGKLVDSQDLGLLVDLMNDLPVSIVVTDEYGEPYIWKDVGFPLDYSDPDSLAQAKTRARTVVRQMDLSNPPIPFIIPIGDGALFTGTIHYAESRFLRRVAWMPMVSAIVALGFAGAALWGFRRIKEGEAQSLWVGMAKETAHQLGTPLSSLAGWLELMKDEFPREGRAQMRRADRIIEDMAGDMDRLQRIASRFGQIGSVPELKPDHLASILDETFDYFRERMPRFGRETTVVRRYDADPETPVNRELLGWAFENLFRNSVDALSNVDGDPTISATTTERDGWMAIVFADNGKGMTPKQLREIFRPGFSTKTRGWGLGLTFVKRIVEDYHGGQISASSAGLGSGTQITIRLPVPEA
jgi:hypothetical protein